MKRARFFSKLGESRMLEAILDTTEALVLVCDNEGAIMYVNRSLEKTTGFTLKEYVGRPVWTFYALDKVAEARRNFTESVGDGDQYQRTAQWRCKNGRALIFSWTIKRLFDDAGTEIGRIATAINMTEQARAASHAIAAERRRRMLVHVTDNLSEPLFFIDPDGRIIYASQATSHVYGYEPEELIGKPSSMLRPMDRVEAMSDYMDRIHKSGSAEVIETEALHRDGHRVEVELRTSPVYEGNEYLGLAAVAYDMTERRALEAELRRLAGTDQLTGVSNRMGYDKSADHEVKRAERYDHPLTVLVADIDHFKVVNDTFGHAGGDAALVDFARVMCETLRRPVDHIARIGGEEFVALLPETDMQGAIAAAKRIRAAVEASVTEHDGAEIRFTVSIGVSRWQPGEADISAVVQRADKALYRAKERGRNQVQFELAPEDSVVGQVG